jgi:drug/metabolite transporter (DMT)-like permease
VATAETRARADAAGGSLVAAAALLFGCVVVFGKFGLRRGLPVTSLLAARYAIGAVVLALALAALHRPLLPAPGERAGLAVLGVFGYALESSLFFAGLEHGTVAAVTLLFFTYPVLVTLESWAIGQGRPKRLTLVALALAVSGAVLVVGVGGGLAIETAGVLFALGAATTYSMYLLGADLLLRRTPPLTSALWVSAGASLGLAVYSVGIGSGQVPSGWTEWWPVLGMGAATAGAFVCLMAGLQRVGAVRAAIVSALEPLAAAVLGAVFLGETVGLGVVLGGVLILAGAIAASLARAVTTREQQIP